MSELSGKRSEVKQLNDMMVRQILNEPAQDLLEGNYGLRVLEVAGRISGRPRRTPVGVVIHQDYSYAVCPDRSRDWAANLDATRKCLVSAGQVRTEHEAVPVGGAEAVAVVLTYLNVMDVPWARDAFDLNQDPTAEEVRGCLDEMAIFRLQSPRAL